LTGPAKDLKIKLFKLLKLDKFLDKKPDDPKYAYIYKALDSDDIPLTKDNYKKYYLAKYQITLEKTIDFELANEMNEVLNKIPASYYQEPMKIELVDLGKYRLGRWEDESKTMKLNQQVFNQELILSPETKVNLGIKVLAHELGHKFDNQYGYSKNEKWRVLSGWTKEKGKDKIRGQYFFNGIWKQSKWHYDQIATFISDYAPRNPKEDFSESFAYYLLGFQDWFKIKDCVGKEEFLKLYVFPADMILPSVQEKTTPMDIEQKSPEIEKAVKYKHFIHI